MTEKRESGSKGGLFTDPMTWTKNPDGTYHIIATRTYLGGRSETYEYDSPTLPLTGGNAWRQGAREYEEEHPQQRAPLGTQIAAALLILAVAIIVMWLVAGSH